MDPSNAGTNDARRIIEQFLRGLSGREVDKNAAQLIHAVDGSGGVVDSRRDRLQRDVDNLQDSELHVLLQRSGWANIECGKQFGGFFAGQAVSLRNHHQRDSCRNEVSDPTQHADTDVIVLRSCDQASLIDKADVAGGIAQDSHFARIRSKRCGILQGVGMARSGHHIVDHRYRFLRNSVDDVIDADGLRDVVNEKQQQANADDR